MRAVDTNVIVRYLTGDDEAQATRARAVVDAGQVFREHHRTAGERVGVAERYGFAADEVAAALRALAGLPGIFVESPSVLAEALRGVDQGMDFADALHLGAASTCEAFLTFDCGLIDIAGNAATVGVMEP